MTVLPRITTFGWVPEFARSFVRDLRPVGRRGGGQPYEVVSDAKTLESQRRWRNQ